jgi:cell division transport system permease protein
VSYAIREALAAFRRAPVLTLLSAAMVGLALFVVGLFGLVAHNLREVLSTAEERVELVAYLRDGTSQAAVDALRAELATLPEVAEVRYVSKAEALEIARRDLPDFGEIFRGLEVNPLPASLEMDIQPGYRTETTLDQLATLVSVHDFVEDVAYGQEWVERLFALRRVGAVTAGVLGAAFALVAALIIGTALRIAIFARRDEIYIMRLVGARDRFIRRPFVLEGGFTGLLGGVLAVILTWVVYRAVTDLLFDASWLPLGWILGGIAAGILFGVLSSGLAVGRHLREV